MNPTPDHPSGRVAVIGDVGGHLNALARELVRLGADPHTLALPADLIVVQVGDLVHRGPDSDAVIALVDRLLAAGGWVQLAGNHEDQYLHEPAFHWPERIGDQAAATLRSWWADGRMRAAAAIEHPAGQWFVSHAGLTEGFWRHQLGSPDTAAHAAAAVNAFIGVDEEMLFSAGSMLGGGPPDLGAGPVWAAAGSELVPSWLDRPLPFHQLHGHSSVVDWRRRRWYAPAEVAELTALDEQRRHATSVLGDRLVVGVDPGHGARPTRSWQAYVLDDATVVG